MNKMPVYIKIDQYEEVLDLVSMIKKRMDVAKHTLERINSLKAEEDRKLEEWAKHLHEAQEKLDAVDMQLGRP